MFTEEEQKKIIDLKKLLNEASIEADEYNYYRIRSNNKPLTTGLCGLCFINNLQISIKLHNKLKELSYKYKKEFNINYNSKFYWFPHDKNTLKYRQDFINWIIQKHFN